MSTHFVKMIELFHLYLENPWPPQQERGCLGDCTRALAIEAVKCDDLEGPAQVQCGLTMFRNFAICADACSFDTK